MADDIVLPIPNLTLPQNLFTLSTPSLAHLHENARTELLQGIQTDRQLSSFCFMSNLIPPTRRNGSILQNSYLHVHPTIRPSPP